SLALYSGRGQGRGFFQPPTRNLLPPVPPRLPRLPVPDRIHQTVVQTLRRPERNPTRLCCRSSRLHLAAFRSPTAWNRRRTSTGGHLMTLRRSLLPTLLVLIGLWLLAGCIYIPMFGRTMKG